MISLCSKIYSIFLDISGALPGCICICQKFISNIPLYLFAQFSGYLKIRSALFCGLSVHFAEYDVLRADNGNDVGEHVAFGHFVHALQVCKAGGADFQTVGFVRAV